MFSTASRIPLGIPPPTTTLAGSSNSATSYIALFRGELVESDNSTTSSDNNNNNSIAIQKYALEQLLFVCLNQLGQWSMIVTILPDLEAMAEEQPIVVTSTTTTTATTPNMKLQCSQLAAAIASQVFFYLEEPHSALRLALLAGSYCPFPSTTATTTTKEDDPYVMTLVRAALDAYIEARQNEWETSSHTTGSSTPEGSSTSVLLQQAQPQLRQPHLLTVTQLQPIVDTILETCIQQRQYTYAIGICYDARDISKLQYVLERAVEQEENKSVASIQTILQYTMKCVLSNTTTTNDRTLSKLIFTTIASHWKQLLDHPSSSMEDKMMIVYDYVQTYQYLNEPPSVAAAIQTLLQPSTTSSTTTNSNDTTGSLTTKQQLTALQIAFDLVDTGDQTFCQQVADALRDTRPLSSSEVQSNGIHPPEAIVYEHIYHVLIGGFVSELSLSFRHRHSQADHKIMSVLKQQMEDRNSGSGRNSVLHTNAIVTHAYLYAGTTHDAFLRNHLDWMKKASHWAKFTATASLGVIHADHVTEAMQLLEPYLPADPDDGGVVAPTGGYAEGGSLYALGLIHGSSGTTNTEKRREAATFVRKHLRASHVNDAISHGACLAVGLTCFGSADPRIVQELKDVLDTDFAVAGEAAGLAIGMVLVGSGAGNIQNALPDNTRDELMDVVSELKNYARETHHEKIIRGIAMGMAIMNFGQEDNADSAIEEMRTDRDPIMRYGAQYAIALAYCGTGSNKAIRILLHTAVSDVSDDVRMAAVIGLAFILFKTPERVPQLVKLLLESFNPHVRYASCMAVGIAMAGSGDSESIALLEPMLDDMTDYVRQGALVGTALMYMQQSDTSNGRKIRSFREKLSTIIAEKHQSTLTKMGAIMSIGIIDAGGRNCALQLGSRTGFTKMTSAVGLVLWLQHWHWFPMMHMFSLALTPTLTIGLNKDLKYPKMFEIVCNSKPSQFAFPKKLQEKKEKEKKHVETFTLSTTAKEKARLARKKAKEEKETMDEGVEEAKSPTEEGEEKTSDAMDVEKEGDEVVDEEEKPKKQKREPEPLQFTIANPARVTKAQSPYCTFDMVNQRYRPIRPNESPHGVIMLNDCTPEEEEYIGTVMSPSLEPLGELAAPEPFEWIAPQLPEVGEDDDDDDDVNENVKESANSE